MKKAQWIWYPGEYEISVTRPLLFQRDYRRIIQSPFWRVDKVYDVVNYMTHVSMPEEEKVLIKGQGQLEIRTSLVPNRPLDECEKDMYILPKGEYEITVSVYHDTKLPALFVRGEHLISDENWVALIQRFRGDRVKVGYNGFYDENQFPDNCGFEYTTTQSTFVENCNGNPIYDFKEESFGYLKFKGLSGAGKITCYYGESLEEARSREDCETLDCVEVKGATDEYIVNHSRGFRFVQIETDIQYQSVELILEMLPLEYKGKFRCDDERVNQIWDIAYKTFHLNSRETFLDGIKRDRWYWGGDTYQSVLMNFYSFFDINIDRRTLTALRGKGVVDMHINHIPDYTFYWFISLYDHYLYSGDEYFAEQIYPRAKSLMDFCLSCIDEKTHMMEKRRQDWVFVDWNAIDKEGALSCEQILLCTAMKKLLFFAKKFNDTEYSAKLQKMHDDLKGLIIKTFWNEEKNLFRHNAIAGKAKEAYTKYSNVFAILYDFFEDPQMNKKMADAIDGNHDLMEIVTPYAKFFELSALAKAGHVSEVVSQIHSYWGGMLDKGATTFWELYDPNDEDYLRMYNRPFGKSLCHAWGSTPLYLLPAFIVGVVPTETAYKKYEIRPQTKDFKNIESTIPTNDGTIHIVYADNRVEIEANTQGIGTFFAERSGELKVTVGNRTYTADGMKGIEIAPNAKTIIEGNWR